MTVKELIKLLQQYPEDIDGSNNVLIVIEKHTDINTQYFFDILFTNIFSNSVGCLFCQWFPLLHKIF